ncbi:MAG: squalene/phytoene synthase family protein [Hyphomicrobium sp.]|nr:squalene/phytoene synthase family protein [Hyphomicrobium sp.]
MYRDRVEECMGAASRSGNLEEVRQAARAHSYDDYLAATLAPRSVAADFMILAAYFGEIARVPREVSETGLGAIRLQWWRDAIGGEHESGHPVADAMKDMIERRGLDRDRIFAPIDAAQALLHPEPFESDAAFAEMLRGMDGAHFGLRGFLLGQTDGNQRETLEALGVSLALIRHCAALPVFFAKGRLPVSRRQLPSDALDVHEGDIDAAVLARLADGLVRIADHQWREARGRAKSLDAVSRQAAATFALAGPYLKALQRVGRDPVRELAELPPLSRVLTLAWTAATGRM